MRASKEKISLLQTNFQIDAGSPLPLLQAPDNVLRSCQMSEVQMLQKGWNQDIKCSLDCCSIQEL